MVQKLNKYYYTLPIDLSLLNVCVCACACTCVCEDINRL